MIAFTAEQVPKINAAVDRVNVMTYDLMNRRDNVTKHHTDDKASLAAVDTYIARGMDPAKMNLGFAFYARWFTTADGVNCSQGLGCACAVMEDPVTGADLGNSGAVTFEKPAVVPANLSTSTDGTCGAAVAFTCKGAPQGSCCSSTGYW